MHKISDKDNVEESKARFRSQQEANTFVELHLKEMKYEKERAATLKSFSWQLKERNNFSNVKNAITIFKLKESEYKPLFITQISDFLASHQIILAMELASQIRLTTEDYKLFAPKIFQNMPEILQKYDLDNVDEFLKKFKVNAYRFNSYNQDMTIHLRPFVTDLIKQKFEQPRFKGFSQVANLISLFDLREDETKSIILKKLKELVSDEKLIWRLPSFIKAFKPKEEDLHALKKQALKTLPTLFTYNDSNMVPFIILTFKLTKSEVANVINSLKSPDIAMANFTSALRNKTPR